MSDTLAARLKRALKARKATQAELARACGIKPPSVSDRVRGESTSMQGDTLLRASAFLRVQPRWLSEGVGPSGLEDAPAAPMKAAEPLPRDYTPPAPLAADLVASLRALSADDLVRAEGMLRGFIASTQAAGLGGGHHRAGTPQGEPPVTAEHAPARIYRLPSSGRTPPKGGEHAPQGRPCAVIVHLRPSSSGSGDAGPPPPGTAAARP